MSITLALFVAAVFGLVMGSFAGATIWRLRAHQIVQDKHHGEDYDKAEYKRLVELTKHGIKQDRSRCLSCRHVLAWYDMIPLVSWLSTKGKCRYCNNVIGWFEPLVELAMALFFVLSAVAWVPTFGEQFASVQFIIWLAITVMLVILFEYDRRWFLLPDTVIYPLIGLSLVYACVRLVNDSNIIGSMLNLGLAIVIFSGVYFTIWVVSSGRWIGFGDVKLGIALGLLTGTWQTALLGLFLANLIGCLIVIPGLISKRLNRKSVIPFGPMLIVGAIIAVLFGEQLITTYLDASQRLLTVLLS